MALDFSATYKLLVLGDSNVGKTCIVHRYCDERYYDLYISTIGKCQVYLPRLPTSLVTILCHTYLKVIGFSTYTYF